MPQSLILKTGSRLHFGPLSYRPQAGRHFGGCGVMISEPGIELETTVAAKDEVVGAAADRISRFVERFRDYFGERLEVPPVRINVREMLPSHVGLGSGTQLALAVAQSLAILSGHSSLSMEELARAMGRGARWVEGECVGGGIRSSSLTDVHVQVQVQVHACACASPPRT